MFTKEIIPAILPKHFQDLEDKLSRLAEAGTSASLVQIDVCDGSFTTSRTWPFDKKEIDKNYLDILSQKEGFPFWEDFDFEADLMVSDPSKIASEWLSAGAVRIVLHLKSAGSDTIARILGDIHERGAEAILALDLNTPHEEILEFIKQHHENIDGLQCMGIAKVGYQNQPFDERVIPLDALLRHEFPYMPISVDGGVSLDTAFILGEAGANRLISGSAIFDTPENSLIEHFEALEEAFQGE